MILGCGLSEYLQIILTCLVNPGKYQYNAESWMHGHCLSAIQRFMNAQSEQYVGSVVSWKKTIPMKNLKILLSANDTERKREH